MMPTFQVDHVADPPKGWKTKDGHQMLTYRMRLSVPGQPGQVEADWNRKPDSPAPQVGQMIDGALEDGQYGKKFKPTPSGSRGSREYAADPKKQAAIAMEASQKLGWEMARFVMENNLQPDVRGQLEKDFAGYTQRLFRMVKEAQDAAS